MELMLLRLFQQQVNLQCKAVLSSAAQANTALHVNDVTGVWIAVQNLLAAAANIAKVCWGSGGTREDGRRLVRESTGLDDDSPLKNVAMRNNFEHLDERLDAWWTTSERHNYLDKSHHADERSGRTGRGRHVPRA
jgi:hypothetical protein